MFNLNGHWEQIIFEINHPMKTETIKNNKLYTINKVKLEDLEKYFETYPSGGYGTKIKETHKDYAIVFRFNSCD